MVTIQSLNDAYLHSNSPCANTARDLLEENLTKLDSQSEYLKIEVFDKPVWWGFIDVHSFEYIKEEKCGYVLLSIWYPMHTFYILPKEFVDEEKLEALKRESLEAINC